MDLISYDDHRMIIDDGSQSEKSQEYTSQTPGFLSLQEIQEHFNENSLIYTQMLTNNGYGYLLLVSPVNTDPVLVDGSCVRLNVHMRDAESAPMAELFSQSRDLISSCQVTCTQDLDGLVNQLLHGFTYCRGLSEDLLESQTDIKDITLQTFNGKIVVRSRKCRSVCVIEDETKENSENLVLCQECIGLCETQGIDPESYHKSQMYDYIPIAEEIRFEIIEDEPPSVTENTKDLDDKLEDISDEKPTEVKPKERTTRKPKKSKPKPSKKDRMMQTCSVCQQNFLFRKDLEKHTQKYADGSCKENSDAAAARLPGQGGKTVGRTHECGVCNKKFANNTSLNIHIESHSQVKGYLCMDCGAAFKSQSGLINHRKRIHMGLKFHQCTQCEKKFYSKKDIDEHTRVHTGDKPFQCPQCGKCFSRAAHLKRHTDTVHAQKDIHQVKDDIQGETETIIIELNRTTKRTKKKSYKTLKALLTKPDLTGRTNPDLIPRPVAHLTLQPPASQMAVRPGIELTGRTELPSSDINKHSASLPIQFHSGDVS